MTPANKCLKKTFYPRANVLRYFAFKNVVKLQQKIKLNIATSNPADEEDLLNFFGIGVFKKFVFKKLELLSATPRATLTYLSCSPNLPRASYLDERTLTHEPIVKYI